MADDDIVEVPIDPEGEFELDSEGNGDLEAAMQEAREALAEFRAEPENLRQAAGEAER